MLRPLPANPRARDRRTLPKPIVGASHTRVHERAREADPALVAKVRSLTEGGHTGRDIGAVLGISHNLVSAIRVVHKCYRREAWIRAAQIISHERHGAQQEEAVTARVQLKAIDAPYPRLRRQLDCLMDCELRLLEPHVRMWL